MRFVIVCIAVMMLASCVFADDVVTMPTANQLKAGEIDVAAYYLKLDMPTGAPQHVNYQTVYVGITDRLELDAHIANVDVDRDSTVLVGQFKVLSETQKLPDLVVGCRNLTGQPTTNLKALHDRSKDRSYYVSAAKTFFANPDQPGPPLVRLHVSLGTSDWTLLAQERHNGLFGGMQFLFRPEVGCVLEYDGQDLITGLALMPKSTGLTIKGGTFGEHWWAGLAFRKAL